MQKYVLAAAVSSLFTNAQPAFAQDQGAESPAPNGKDEVVASGSGPQLQKVIVSAQRRQESLQKVPIAVTVVSPDHLAQTGRATVESLLGEVPNLNVTQNIGQARVTLRGIGVDNISLGSEGSIAFYQDNVFFTRSNAAMASFFDIDRLEVLRGPQGTLYGRNATGGSINIFTKQPSRNFDGYLSTKIGNYGAFDTEGAVGGPMSENVEGRISFQTRYRDGFGTNIATGTKIDDEKSQAVRGQLAFRLGDLNVRVEGDYYNKNDHSNGGHYFGQGLQSSPGVFVEPLGQQMGGIVATDVRDLSNARDPFVKAKFYGGRIDVRDSISDEVHFRSITAYRRSQFNSLTDISGSSFDLFPLYNWEYGDQVSQEFQLNIDTDTHNAVIGMYYLYDRVNGGSNGPYNVGTLNAPFLLQGYWAGGVLKTNAAAVFGEDAIKLRKDVRLTLGARYSYEKKKIDNVVEFNFVNPYSPAYEVTTPYRRADKSWTSFTPKIGLNYDLSDTAMLYGTLSRGFKAGTFDLEAIGPAVNPESVDALDFGVKYTSSDSKMRVNLAGFYYKYKDMQVGKVTGATLVLENAATAKISGIEAEFTALPFSVPLQFNFNAALLHARFDEYVSQDPARPFGDGHTLDSEGKPAFNLSGNTLSQAPKYTATASLEYPISTSSGLFTLRGESTWSGRVYFDAFNTKYNSQAAYNLQNASIAYSTNDKHWSGSLFVSNIRNKTVIGGAHVGYVPIGAPIMGYLVPPRQFGVTLRRNF